MKNIYTIDIIPEIIKKNPGIEEINLTVYKYIPQSLNEKGRVKFYSLKCDKPENVKKEILSIKVPKGWRLGLTSRVKMKDGSCRHIPQIDFECEVSSKRLKEIKDKLSKIVKTAPGYIMESGASYQYIGLKLIKEKDWHKFMDTGLTIN